MAVTFTFQVNAETMQRIRDQRLSFFESQIGEAQLNITILTKAVEVYNDSTDIAALAMENAKLDKLMLNYQTVSDMAV